MNGRKGIQLSKQYLFVGRNVDLRGGLSIAAVNQARRLSPAGWLSLNFRPVGLTLRCGAIEVGRSKCGTTGDFELYRHQAKRRADFWEFVKGIAIGMFIGGLFALPLSAAIFVWLF